MIRTERVPLGAVLLLGLSLCACKLFKKGSDDSEAVPSADIPALPPTAQEPPKPADTASAVAADDTADKPKTATPVPQPTKTASKTDAGTASAKDAGAASTAKDAGTKPADAACKNKCNNALLSCMTPTPVDGGLPKLPDPNKCKSTYDACVAACK